jgi:ribonuclease D
MPRGILESRAQDILTAVRQGLAVPEAQLPRFAKAPRWDRDPDFDARVSALKTARDVAATRLEMDPGVLCSRDRMEAVARKNPTTLSELESITELRHWQVELLGADFLEALAPHRREKSAQATSRQDDSPYSDG